MRAAVTHYLWPGGALRYLREQLVHRSPDVTYDLVEPAGAQSVRATMSELADIAELADRHVVVPSTGGSGRIPPRVRDLRAIDLEARALARAIDAGGYDVVCLHPDGRTYTPWVLAHLHTPAVLVMHEPPRFLYEHEWRGRRRVPARSAGQARRLAEVVDAAVARRWLARRDPELAQRDHLTIVANSAFGRESILRTYGVSAAVCRPGVDLDVFAPTGLEPGGYVLAVGGLEASKRHDVAVDVVGAIDAAVRPRLRIVCPRGAPRPEARLREAAVARGVDLEVQSGLTDGELAAVYEQAAVTLCVARLEPFGLTALESIAVGTPVVAIEEGGFREVVRHGENGLVVDDSVDSLAYAVARVLAGEVCFERAAVRATVTGGGWSWADAMARLESVLRRAAG
jgi:glycosyltransferase involved in cell wall biosynthesis